MLIKYDDGASIRGLFLDTERQVNTPHGFHWVYCEINIPSLTLRPTSWGREICVTDDFGTLTPGYTRAVLNLKQEGH